MVTTVFEILARFIISVISHSGYLGIVFLMGIESACIPLPSEVIMPFSGYLVSAGRFKLIWVKVYQMLKSLNGMSKREIMSLSINL